ncbi:MAG: patatin-like phospholipase family protein [Candidatus Marinimicrobia bacterium]|nr:patatin-like phospholipase family protein [Candidatus Neomarinimicrobiota bacterium]
MKQMFKNIIKSKRKKIGIALGSGSSRGWAHVGVLEALEKNGIKIDYIAGTSIGSFVGTVYSAGELQNLKKFVLKMNRKDVLNNLDFAFPRYGFLTTDKVPKLLGLHTNKKEFSELNIPLKIVATKLLTGEEIVFDSGSLVDAISASSAVPGIVIPFVKNGEIFVDGGIVNPVPVDIVRKMGADIVIAIDLSKKNINEKYLTNRNNKFQKNIDQKLYSEIYFKNIQNPIGKKITKKLTKVEKNIFEQMKSWKKTKVNMPNIFETFSISIDVMEKQITKSNYKISKPDIIINPQLDELNFFDFNHGKESIDEGYSRTIEKINEIKQLINR